MPYVRVGQGPVILGRGGVFNRPDAKGAALSAAAPALAVLVGNLLIALSGVGQADAAYDRVSFSPPGWVVGLVWLAIYPMWGMARWHAWQAGADGRRASRWVIALMAWGLAYPVMTALTGVVGSAVLNVVSLAFAVTVTAVVARQTTRGGAWMVPSVVWLAFASILGVAAVGYA